MDENDKIEKGQTQVHRVVRGGAFNNNHRNARCAYRNKNNPNNRNNNIGFRVVLRTFFICRKYAAFRKDEIQHRDEK